jgi:hypothetical protein
VVVVDPIDLDHSTVTSYSLADPAERPQEPAEGRSLIAEGLMEDNEMSLAVQRGLHAGANRFVEFGRHESAIGHFHRTLDERLDGSAQPR